MYWQMCLENLEELLQLHHQRPIGLDQIVAEVILAGIDTLAGDLRKRKRGRTERISFVNNVYKLQSIKVFAAQSLIVASALCLSPPILSWQFQKILIFARCILIFLSHTHTHTNTPCFQFESCILYYPDTGYRRALQVPYRIMQPTIMAMALHIKCLRIRQARYYRVIRYHLGVTFPPQLL